ncbi:hypothetical protein Ndes2526B_g05242 [Nannochloris sp. 'desiccata']|nr:hypothetical protein KSW81_000158 [Chlorella desiccata (nom. nud.)]KAH7617775.1 putative Coatomer subunit zeta-2 [Chlorella desiccata (nom. nud.)]KAH7619994.1 putative Coatomer subunit zeta-2 [Chlorella desiccata (nom. nud.)]
MASQIDPMVPTVKALILLDDEGKRIAVQYFAEEWKHSVGAQSNFEKSVYAKTSRTNARGEPEVIMFDDVVVTYKFIGDLMFYVVGHADENEIVLANVLVGFYDSVAMLLRNAVEKKTVLENLDLVLLCMDELAEGGLILETDPTVIATRVTMRQGEGSAEEMAMAMENPGLQSLSVAFGNVKEQLARSLLK